MIRCNRIVAQSNNRGGGECIFSKPVIGESTEHLAPCDEKSDTEKSKKNKKKRGSTKER